MKKTSQIKVLLADDHAVVRAGLRQFLERAQDIQVVAETGDGEAAKALIQRYRPDVVVLDIQMPGASGIEVTRWVRAHHRSTGVLILTAYDDHPYVVAVLQAGANGYGLKTAHPDEIIQSVRDVNEGKSVLDQAIAQQLVTQLAQGIRQPVMESLTDRELEVLALVARGHTNRAIGAQLEISDRTVQGHLAHIFAKLQANSRTEAVMRAVSLGWLPHDIGQMESV